MRGCKIKKNMIGCVIFLKKTKQKLFLLERLRDFSLKREEKKATFIKGICVRKSPLPPALTFRDLGEYKNYLNKEKNNP